MRSRWLELLRFGSVGAAAFVVDVGLFNLLRFGPGGLLRDQPLRAKVLSVAVATVVAWLGNRYWTFAGRRTSAPTREFLSFAMINVIGMGIAVGCLAVSHYALGLTSPLADNIAANVVGLGLGTIFRYLAYRRLVFTASAPLIAAAQPAAGRHEGSTRQHEVGVERAGHSGEEHGEHRGAPLGQLEPTAVRGDQIPGERQPEPRPTP